MSITHVTSVSQLNDILAKSEDKISVIDFHANWCGPCHAIAPTYELLSRQYPDVNFLKCDVDTARDVASLYGISAMPTFIYLKGSTKIEQVRGANKSALESALIKHAVKPPSGEGQTTTGSSPTPDVAEDA